MSKGIMMGKLKMAINVKLLPVLDAIAETIVNKEEKPKLPSASVNKKRAESWMMLPTNKL